MDDLRLALRAFRWRRGGSVVVLLVGALTIATAAIGPLYSSAAVESVLQDRLAQATGDETTIAFRSPADVSYPGFVDVVSSAQADRGTIPGYGPLVNETVVSSSVRARGGQLALSEVLWRDGACAHLDLVSGACPRGPGEALVSERSADALRWNAGTRLLLDQLRQYDTAVPRAVPLTVALHLTVVGLYRPRSTVDPFWAGRVYFGFHPAVGSSDGPTTVDAVFVDRAVFASLVTPTNGSIGADLLLTDPAAIRVADLPRVRAAVAAYLGPVDGELAPRTGLPVLLDRIEAEQAQTAVAASVVSAQLALLALLLLYLVLADTSEARGGEVALAKLRGLPARAVVAVALREPVVLLGLAAPLGLALAYIGALALARRLFVPGVPVVVDRSVWVAVGLALLGGLGAALVASRRVLTRPVLDQWSTSRDPGRSSQRGAVAGAALVLVAVVGLVALDRARHPTESPALAPLGWIAPGLLVVALALLLLRLAVPVLSALVRATRASARVGPFLAVRHVARRPAGLRLAGLLAITLGLATFAVDAQAAAAQGRLVRAGADVGATMSLAVPSRGVVDLESAVRSVDPDGRWAMVAAEWIPDGGSVSGSVLGVEPAVLGAVALWSPDYGAGTAAEAAAVLSPPMPAPLPLGPGTLRVRITSGAPPSPAPDVLVAFRDERGRRVTVPSTPLAAGTHDYAAAMPCRAAGCTFAGVALDRSQDTGSARLDLLVTAVEQRGSGAWSPVPAPLDHGEDWRVGAYTGRPVGTVTAAADGLRYVGTPPPYASPFVQYADAPVPLPMITTPGSSAQSGDAGAVLLDRNATSIPVRGVAGAQVLPVVGDDGVMVDLAALRHLAPRLEDDARWSVWLGPQAPADALARLARAGIQVDAVTTTSARAEELGREGPALALKLLLVCALVGSVLAASAVAISIAVTGRRRSYELAALRAVAVPRGSLVLSCILEQGLLLGLALLVGVPTGLLVARVALPALPQSSSATVLPLTLDVQTLAVSGFVVVTVVLLTTTAVVAGLTLVRQAVPDLLREDRDVTVTALDTGLALHCQDVHHVYAAETGDTVAIVGITLTVRAGETLAVLGPSGSGKSTLLAIIAGLLRPTSGQVYVGGDDMTLMSERELLALRAQRLGVVVQDPARNLLPYASAEENVRFAQRGVRGFRRASLPDAAELLDSLGLAHLSGRPVGALSGGEQQRLAVAMGMAGSPGLLLIDEPTSQLDAANREAVVDLVGVIGATFGTTVLVVTHDPEVAGELGRTVTITQGVASDETQRLPQHLYVDRDGRVELPEDLHRQLPPGSRARIVRRPHGVELVRDELPPRAPGEWS